MKDILSRVHSQIEEQGLQLVSVYALTACRLFVCTQSEVYVKSIGVELLCGALYFLKGIVELLDTGVFFALGGEHAVVPVVTKYAPQKI